MSLVYISFYHSGLDATVDVCHYKDDVKVWLDYFEQPWANRLESVGHQQCYTKNYIQRAHLGHADPCAPAGHW